MYKYVLLHTCIIQFTMHSVGASYEWTLGVNVCQYLSLPPLKIIETRLFSVIC